MPSLVHGKVVLGSWFALIGCASSQFDGRTFENDQLAFRVRSVPAEWRQVDAEGPLLAFRDDAAPASIAIGGRCDKDGDDVPLRSLTHHLFLHFSERQVLSQRTVQLDGREALHTEMIAKLDGVLKQFSVFVFKKDGCVYDFIHLTPPDASEASRDRFDAFVRGFSTLKP